MSELDELEDLASNFKFGTLTSLAIAEVGGRRRQKFCDSPNHMQDGFIRTYKDKRGHARFVCRLCDRARRRAATPECRP